MFRDEKQTHSAIRALLATLPGLGRLWTDTGPTDEAAEVDLQREWALVGRGEAMGKRDERSAQHDDGRGDDAGEARQRALARPGTRNGQAWRLRRRRRR